MSETKPTPTNVQLKKLPTGIWHLTWVYGGQNGQVFYLKSSEIVRDCNKKTIHSAIRKVLSDKILSGEVH